MAAPVKKSVFSSLLDPLTGTDMLRAEKARLEAFLAAVPGEYCGFAADGSVAYSEGFAKLLNLSAVKTIHDVQDALETGDASVLEGFFHKLEENNKPFSLHVKSVDSKKIFRLSGSRGQDLTGADSFNILWIEDITETQAELASLKKSCDIATAE